MPKPTEKTLFNFSKPVAETAMDKTTRIVREISDGEAEKRQAKMARLRKARLERDAHTPKETKSPTLRSVPKQTATRAVK